MCGEDATRTFGYVPSVRSDPFQAILRRSSRRLLGAPATALGPRARAGLAVLLIALLTAVTARAQTAPWATGASRPEDLTIELVSFGPGEAIHQVFGHAALRVTDRRLGEDRLYNYGMFSFGPDMIPNFVRGRLTFWAAEQPPNPAIVQYILEDRQVIRQRLNLGPAARAAMARRLAHDVLPESREYLYHHYNDNCATRLADAIDEATGAEFKKALSGPARHTLREHTRRHVTGNVLFEFLMMHGLSGRVDRPITRYQELFLPGELERAVHEVQIRSEAGHGVPLESRRIVMHRSGLPPVPETARPLWPHLLGIGLLISVLLLATNEAHARRASRWRRVQFGTSLILTGLVFGLLGTLTAFLAWATDHDVAHDNQNVLLANPVLFGLCVAGVGVALGRPWWRRWHLVVALAMAATTAIALVMKLLPGSYQDNTDSLALIVPVNLMLLVLAGRERRARGGSLGKAS